MDIGESRMAICKKCPLYLKKFGGVCNQDLFLNPETGDISLVKKPGYKNGCGCRLVNKTQNEASACPLKKW